MTTTPAPADPRTCPAGQRGRDGCDELDRGEEEDGSGHGRRTEAHTGVLGDERDGEGDRAEGASEGAERGDQQRPGAAGGQTARSITGSVAELPRDDEEDQGGDATEQEAEGERGGPAPGAPLGEADEHTGETEGEGGDAAGVEAAAGGRRRPVGDVAADAEQTRDGDQRGADEDAAEADRVGDLAARDGVDAREAAADGGDDAGRLAEAGGTEQPVQGEEREGEHGGRDALEDPARDEARCWGRGRGADLRRSARSRRGSSWACGRAGG